jgi:hypothetical protein
MGMRIKLLAFVIGLTFLLTVLRCVRQNSFRPAYAVLWLGMSAFLLSIPLLEPFYQWVAHSVIGIADARHVIYIVVLGFLLVYSLYLTSMVSRMSNQIRQLISAEALLRVKLKTNPRDESPNPPSSIGQSQ